MREERLYRGCCMVSFRGCRHRWHSAFGTLSSELYFLKDLTVSDGTLAESLYHLPSVQHDSGLLCLWTREKAGLRPTQSPNSHWMICSPPSSPQYLSTIWHLMRSTDENGSTCAKCEGEHRSPCRGVKNNNNLVFTFLIFSHFIFNIKQIFTNQNLINFS